MLFVGIIYAGSRALSRLVRNEPVEISSLLPLLCKQKIFPSYMVFNAVPGLRGKEAGGV